MGNDEICYDYRTSAREGEGKVEILESYRFVLVNCEKERDKRNIFFWRRSYNEQKSNLEVDVILNLFRDKFIDPTSIFSRIRLRNETFSNVRLLFNAVHCLCGGDSRWLERRSLRDR